MQDDANQRQPDRMVAADNDIRENIQRLRRGAACPICGNPGYKCNLFD